MNRGELAGPARDAPDEPPKVQSYSMPVRMQRVAERGNTLHGETVHEFMPRWLLNSDEPMGLTDMIRQQSNDLRALRQHLRMPPARELSTLKYSAFPTVVSTRVVVFNCCLGGPIKGQRSLSRSS